MFKTTIFMIMSTIIVAHRGGAEIANENTLTSFQQAIDLGVEMVELDVHMTLDTQVVGCHDFTIDRTSNGSGKIEDMTLEQFKQAKVLDRDTKKPTAESMPTLKESLELLKGKTTVLLEIKRRNKNQYLGLEQKIIDMIHEMEMMDQVVIQSFDDQALFAIHELDSAIRIEKLLFCRLPFGLCFDGKISKFSYEKYRMCASLNFMYKFINQKKIDKLHAEGFEVKVWTVDEPSKLHYKVDGVITNRPDLFLKR
jgi:glycerophosphoryl diester phosphodiesterase